MDIVNKRKYMQTSECKKEYYDFYYIIELFDETYSSLGYNYVTSDVGFGDVRVQNLAPGDYTVEIYRYSNPEKPLEFVMTTWATKDEIKLN